jgi:hypothetical protein
MKTGLSCLEFKICSRMICLTSDRFTDGIKGASGYKYVLTHFRILFSLADCENMGSRLIDRITHS